MRILHGPVNVADQAPAMAEQQRRLGASAVSFEVSPHPFYPPSDVVGCWKVPGRWEGLWAQGHAFYRFAGGFDVLHLHSTAFLPHILSPLPIRAECGYLALVKGQLRRLRALGKVLAVTFHGDEVRPIAEIRDEWLDSEAVLGLPGYDERARASRLRYSRTVAAECDLVYVTTPDLLPCVPRALLAPTIPSRPFSTARREAHFRPQRAPGSPLRVVHAPSNPVVKGSALIRTAVDSLSASGVPVELEVLQGRQVDDVVAAVKRADVLVDQVNVGWYGVLAVEAQWMSVPTLARLSSRNVGLFEEGMGRQMGLGSPMSFGNATELTDALRNIAAGADSGGLERLANEARSFALRFHDGALNARRMLDDYRRVDNAKFSQAPKERD